MKKPIRLCFVAIALPADLSLEDSGLMDALSNLRDGDEEIILEWAQALNPLTGKRDSVVVDGESDEMVELFESNYVSPARFEQEGR